MTQRNAPSASANTGAAADLLALAAEDYAYDDGIFAVDEGRVAAAKWALTRLPPADRDLLILYAESRSLARLSALTGRPRSSLFDQIKRIRAAIVSDIETNYDG